MGDGVNMLRDQATAIIPCYNVEDNVQECVGEGLLQGEALHQALVVDNYAGDSAVSRAKEWHKAHPTFSLTITKEKNSGICNSAQSTYRSRNNMDSVLGR